MRGVILDPAPPKLRRARDIVVVPRLPDRPPEETYRSPFDAEGDIVVDCDMPGCTWHAVGLRRDVGFAVREHHRLFHPEQTGVIRLNAPRQ